jgi:hypothetical protein
MLPYLLPVSVVAVEVEVMGILEQILGVVRVLQSGLQTRTSNAWMSRLSCFSLIPRFIAMLVCGVNIVEKYMYSRIRREAGCILPAV